MELMVCKEVFTLFVSSWLLFSVSYSVEGLHVNSKVRGVNLGGWLVVEGWIKPSLFNEIPNGDMLDGIEVYFKSVTTHKYVSAENDGGGNITVDRDIPSAWETYRFLMCGEDNHYVDATIELPPDPETFYLERNSDNRIHIKLKSGVYLQASKENQLTADYLEHRDEMITQPHSKWVYMIPVLFQYPQLWPQIHPEIICIGRLYRVVDYRHHLSIFSLVLPWRSVQG